jgi:hypothetical protein
MVTWHPILSAVEVEPGQWVLTAQTGPYGVVRLLTVGGALGYRAVTFSEPRELIGYYRTLKAACAAAHTAYLRTHGPHPSTVGYPSNIPAMPTEQ